MGALTPCHSSSASSLHRGTVFTKASKVDHLLEKLFKYLTQCTHGARTVRKILRNQQTCGAAPSRQNNGFFSVRKHFATNGNAKRTQADMHTCHPCKGTYNTWSLIFNTVKHSPPHPATKPQGFLMLHEVKHPQPPLSCCTKHTRPLSEVHPTATLGSLPAWQSPTAESGIRPSSSSLDAGSATSCILEWTALNLDLEKSSQAPYASSSWSAPPQKMVPPGPRKDAIAP